MTNQIPDFENNPLSQAIFEQLDPRTSYNYEAQYHDKAKSYWDRPVNVARAYRDIQDDPSRDWSQVGIDRNLVEQAYQRLGEHNRSESWWNWRPLDDNDPFKVSLLEAPEPAPEVQYDKPVKLNLPDASSQPGTTALPTAVDLASVPGWQRGAAFLLSNGALQGAAMAFPWMTLGAVAGFAAGGPVPAILGAGGALAAGFLLGFSGDPENQEAARQKLLAKGWNPKAVDFLQNAFNKTLGVLNKPAEWTEQSIGTAAILGNAALPMLPYKLTKYDSMLNEYLGAKQEYQRLLDNIPAVWDAARSTYEAAATTALGGAISNLPAGIEYLSDLATQGQTDVVFARQGEIHRLGDPQPVKIDAVGIGILQAAVNEIIAGGNPEKVTEKYNLMTGFSGQFADLLYQSGADPFNALIPMAERGGVKVFSKVTGNALLETAQRTAAGEGVVGTFKQYGVYLRRGLDVEGNLAPQPWEMTRFQRWLADVTPDGMMKDLQPGLEGATTRAKRGLLTFAESPLNPVTWWNSAKELTPKSKYTWFTNLAQSNMGELMGTYDDVDLMMSDIISYADMKPAEAVVLGRQFQNAEMYTVLQGLKGYGERAKNFQEIFRANADRRELLLRVSAATGESYPSILARLREGGAKEAGKIYQEYTERIRANAAGDETTARPEDLEAFQVKAEAARAMLSDARYTPEIFKIVAAEVKRNPWSFDPGYYKGFVYEDINNHLETWAIKAFGVKPESGIVRAGNAFKAIQSLLLLDFSPGYAFTNGMSNIATRAAEGSFGYLGPERVEQYLNWIGHYEARVEAGTGIAGQDNRPARQVYASAEEAYRDGGYMAEARYIAEETQAAGSAAVRAKDWIQRVQDNTPVGPMRKFSGKLETWDSIATHYTWTKGTFARLWRRGSAIPAMPEGVRRSLAGLDPRLPDLVMSGIEASVDKGQLNRILTGITETAKKADPYIEGVAKALGIDSPFMREMLAKTNVLDKVNMHLANGATPEEAVGAVKRDISNILRDQMVDRVRINAAAGAARVRGEGMAALAQNYRDTAWAHDEFWARHFMEWERTYQAAKNLTGPQRKALIKERALTQDNEWQIHNANQEAIWTGFLREMGFTNGNLEPLSKKFIGEMTAIHQLWKEFFQERSRRMSDYFKASDKASPEYKDMLWDALQNDLMQIYQRNNAIELQATRRMGELYLQMWRGQLGGEHIPGVAYWWKGIYDTTEYRQNLMIAMRMWERNYSIDEATAPASLVAAYKRVEVAIGETQDRSKAWPRFLEKVYLPAIGEITQAHLNGINAVADASTGRPVNPEWDLAVEWFNSTQQPTGTRPRQTSPGEPRPARGTPTPEDVVNEIREVANDISLNESANVAEQQTKQNTRSWAEQQEELATERARQFDLSKNARQYAERIRAGEFTLEDLKPQRGAQLDIESELKWLERQEEYNKREAAEAERIRQTEPEENLLPDFMRQQYINQAANLLNELTSQEFKRGYYDQETETKKGKERNVDWYGALYKEGYTSKEQVIRTLQRIAAGEGPKGKYADRLRVLISERMDINPAYRLFYGDEAGALNAFDFLINNDTENFAANTVELMGGDQTAFESLLDKWERWKAGEYNPGEQTDEWNAETGGLPPDVLFQGAKRRQPPPGQMSMFSSGEDLPLFSGTAERAQESLFAPKPAETQGTLFDMRPQMQGAKQAEPTKTFKVGDNIDYKGTTYKVKGIESIYDGTVKFVRLESPVGDSPVVKLESIEQAGYRLSEPQPAPGFERQAVTDEQMRTMQNAALDIQYLIVKANGMATKSRVEDHLIRMYGIDRGLAHDIMNIIESKNILPFVSDGKGGVNWNQAYMIRPEPKPEQYPGLEIGDTFLFSPAAKIREDLAAGAILPADEVARVGDDGGQLDPLTPLNRIHPDGLKAEGWDRGIAGLFNAVNKDRTEAGLPKYATSADVPWAEARAAIDKRVTEKPPSVERPVKEIERLANEIRDAFPHYTEQQVMIAREIIRARAESWSKFTGKTVDDYLKRIKIQDDTGLTPEQVKAMLWQQKAPPEPSLVAMHNLTVENLLQTAQLGGMPSPSLAIVKGADAQEFQGYGEISLIGNRLLIDPEYNRENRVFNADIYSPTIRASVDIVYKPMTVKRAQKVFDNYRPIYEEINNNGYTDGNYYEVWEALTRGNYDKGISAIEGSSVFMIKFIREKGLTQPEYKPLVDRSNTGDWRRNEDYRRQLRAEINGREMTDEFYRWAREVMSNIGEPMIKHRGRRIPYTLDNLMMVLTSKKNIRGAEGGLGYGPARVKADIAKEFKSVGQMHRAEDELVPRAEFDAWIKEHQEPTLNDFQARLVDRYIHKNYDGRIDTWAAMDDMMKALRDYIKGGRGWPRSDPKSIFGFYGFKNLDDADVNVILDAAHVIKNAPTTYFEAKPQRIVYLSEFSHAVIPSKAPKEIIKILEDNNIKYTKYYGYADMVGVGGLSREDAVRSIVQDPQAAARGILFQGAKKKAGPYNANEVYEQLDKVGYTPASVAAEMLNTNDPKYITEVLRFIMDQREKVVSGKATTRDIAKALLITVASQGSRERPLETMRPKFEKAGIDIPWDRIDTVWVDGKDQVRPEDVFAAWLFTDEGQRLLDSIEDGSLTPEQLQRASLVRMQYGDDRFTHLSTWGPYIAKEKRLKGHQAPDNPNEYNIWNVAKAAEEINALRDAWQQDPAAAMKRLETIASRMKGVGPGKLGFIKSFLGFGDTVTFDTVELSYWLTGQKGVRGAPDTLEGRVLRSIDADPRMLTRKAIQDKVYGAINERFQELRAMGYGADISPELFSAFMHHWVWDSAKGTRTTHRSIVDAMRFAQGGADGETPRGAVDFAGKDYEAIITAFKSADISTLTHELGHVFRRDLTGDDHDTAARWAGAIWDEESKTWTWTREAEERFADGFNTYLEEGIAPTPKLKQVFEKFKTWLAELYKVIQREGVEINDDMRAVYARLLGGEPGRAAAEAAGPAPATAPAAERVTVQRYLDSRIIAGKPIRGAAYVDGKFAAYIPYRMDLNQRFDTGNGPARILGINADGQWVYRLEQTGEVKTMTDGDEQIPVNGPYVPGTMEAAGAVPVDEGGMWGEGMQNYIDPILDELANQMRTAPITAGQGPGGFDLSRLSADDQANLKRWIENVGRSMSAAKMAAIRTGDMHRDFALLDYGKRYGFDNAFGLLFPYQFWFTRSMINWAARFVDRPGFLSFFARLSQFKDESLDDRFKEIPSRLKGKVRIPVPWLKSIAPWAGDAVYLDPWGKIFPFREFVRPWERYTMDQTRVRRKAEQFIRKWTDEGTVTVEEAQAAMNSRTGPLWQRALAEANGVEGPDALDYLSLISSPNLALSLAIRGPDKTGPYPLSRMMQGLAAVTGWEGLAKLDPEAKLRKAAKLSEFGEWGTWYIDRQLSNLAADGTITPRDAVIAMIEKQGPAYDMALENVRMELAVRQPSLLPVLATRNALRGDGNILDILGSALIGLMPGGLLPTGELKLRGLYPEYQQAWADKNSGKNPEAVNNFYKAHPEYETRLALYDEPEERLRQFLVSEVWDRWAATPEVYRNEAKRRLGQDFAQMFLSSETRDTDAISIETLASWTKQLGGYAPGDSAPAGTQPMTFDGGDAAAQYDQLKEALFPGIGPILSKYYAAEGDQKAMLKAQFPEIQQYYNWRDIYISQNPELIPYMAQSDPELAAADKETAYMVYMFRAEKARLFPEISMILDEYYSLPADQRRRSPDKQAVNQYYSWEKDMIKRFPQIARFVKGDASAFKALYGSDYTKEHGTPINVYNWPVEVQSALARYYGANKPLGDGARSYLYYQWEKAGKPLQSYEKWLKSLGVYYGR